MRWEQACTALHKGERCQKPATELGALCGAHWRALSPAARSTLEWEATWAVDIPERDVLPASAMLSDWDIVRAAEAMLGD
jgi:hypothetical protein